MRRSKKRDQKLADNAHLPRAWKKWHREELEEAREGVHGAVVAEIMGVLDQLELESASVLLDHVRRTDWHAVSADVRLTILHQVNNAITKPRERHNLKPIDDPFPGERESVFRTIKSMMNSR